MIIVVKSLNVITIPVEAGAPGVAERAPASGRGAPPAAGVVRTDIAIADIVVLLWASGTITEATGPWLD
ncbi:hypothetical protein [Micromonospora sp. ATCC 39149]|uniref:Uncharacterized protein n=1 Tax=Micromonospora carbonacea TaxID=47853 RepID=A0A7D6C5N6_9ACTN|nr:hypothetical protein [Micromonospora sp. ATCC 39149]QLJ98444.1 hypothetical protein HZU44_27840 [Micromonospora carbonacea]